MNSYDLPKDVFVEGETRPTKKKVKKTLDAKPTQQKRSLSNAGLDVSSERAQKLR